MSYIEYITGDYEASDPLPDLARTNHFTVDDLAQNRAGKISDGQMKKLFAKALFPIRYPAMALLGWLTCCFIVKTLVPGFVLVIAGLIGLKGIGVLLGAITILAVLSLFVALLRSGKNVFLLIQDLAAGKSAYLEGRVTTSREAHDGLGMDRLHNQKHMQCFYVVQNQYFEVDESAAEALPYGGKFRLYFAPKSKLLLSIEPVPAATL